MRSTGFTLGSDRKRGQKTFAFAFEEVIVGRQGAFGFDKRLVRVAEREGWTVASAGWHGGFTMVHGDGWRWIGWDLSWWEIYVVFLYERQSEG